jgi:TIR domain
MAHDVFISHSTRDKDATDAICGYLESHGIRCWVAPRDILPGNDWAEAIVDAIASSKLMLLVFSSNANTSSQINRELSVAANNDVPVIPFRIEEIQPSKKLQYYLSTPHWIDAIPPPVDNHLDFLATSIRGLLPPREESTEKGPDVIDAGSKSIPRTELVERKRAPGIERFFIFNDASEPISDRAKLIWIVLTIASCFAMIAGFTAAMFAFENSGRSGQTLTLAVSLNIRTGLMIVCGWTMALLARTHPIYGYFAGFLASATVSFVISINMLGATTGFGAVWMITFTLVNLWVFATALGGIFLHQAYLWIYAGLMSMMAIVFALYYGGSDLLLIIAISTAELVLALVALFLHRRRNLRRAEEGAIAV